MDPSGSAATIITSEYADEKRGGLGTYIDMLAPYLESRFDALQVVLISFENRETFEARTGCNGETIVELPFPQTRYRAEEAEYQKYVDEATRHLDLRDDDLVLGNDWFGGYVAEKLIDTASGTPAHVLVPHLYRSLMMLYGYEGEDFDELIDKSQHARFKDLLDIEEQLLESANAVLFCSEFMRDYTFEQIQVAPSHFGVVEHYTESAPAVKESYRDEIRDVIFAGRFITQKGILDLAEHMRAILDCLPEAHFHFYGRGGMESLLEWGIRRFDRVTLHEFIPREDLLRLLPDMDLMVMPSIFEPFGYSALEAMAAGVPIAATDTGGLGQLTSWLPEGLRFRRQFGTHPLYRSPGNVGAFIPREEFLRVFRFARENPSALRESAQRGRRVVREQYNRDRYRSEMDDFLASI